MTIVFLLSHFSQAQNRIHPVMPDIVFPSDAGIINVTQPPYNAKGDGITDDTAAINAALRDHNNANASHLFMTWTVYLPAGTYLVSGPLEPKDPNNPKANQCGVRIMGQGVNRTRIQLIDNAPGFNDPVHPQYLLRTGNDPSKGGHPNSGFGNYIQHLTIDVGANNPGAAGIRFDVANCGSLAHVHITSSDPQKAGVYGLGFFEQCGLGYVKNTSINGFDYGIYLDRMPVNNLGFENIEVKNQNKAGIFNEGKNIQIRGLVSTNRVPAIQIKKNYATTLLLDAQLNAVADSTCKSAIKLQDVSYLFLRGIQNNGYPLTVDLPDGFAKADLPQTAIDEWATHDNSQSHGKSLNLPIKDAPEYYNSDLNQWASVVAYGATPNNPRDNDSPGIQAAIDSGKKIVYFPRGKYTLKSDVIVRGNVRKIDFLFSYLQGEKRTRPAIRVCNKNGQTVILENMAMANHQVDLVHDSTGSTVIRNRGGFGKILTTSNSTGDLHVEVAGPNCRIEVRNGIHAWVRALNRECTGLLNHGATLWCFADNIERMLNHKNGKTRIKPFQTINGGTTEYLGGAIDALWVEHKQADGPLFTCIDSTLSAVYAGELWHNQRGIGSWPKQILIRHDDQETELTQSHTLSFKKANENNHVWRMVMPLYRSK